MSKEKVDFSSNIIFIFFKKEVQAIQIILFKNPFPVSKLEIKNIFKSLLYN